MAVVQHDGMRIHSSPLPLVLSRDDGTSHIDRRWRAGKLHRLFRGVYVETSAWNTLSPWQKYLVRIHGALAADPNRVLFGESAAAAVGVLIPHASRPIHVLSPGVSSREYRGVRSHVSVDAREIIVIDGIRLTSMADTVVDIARSRPPAEALAYADALLRVDSQITREQLVALNQALVSGRGRRQARWALSRATGVPESPLESASLAVIEWLGYESPILQHPFLIEGKTYKGDFFWEHERIVGEADGDAKYSTEMGNPTDTIIDEKRRENLLRRHTSGVARWGWKDVQEAEPLDQALRSAGLRPTRVRDTMNLATMRPFGR